MDKAIKIGVLGAGVMGTVLIKSLVKFCSPRNILVCDSNQAKLRVLRKAVPDLHLTTQLAELSKQDVIFLAVKPQDFFNLKIRAPQALIVSIMAGVKINKIRQKLNSNKIARAMHNTPARLGKGFVVWTVTPAVDKREKIWLGNFWKILGEEIYVAKEEVIDKATAITGSGPAYIFYNLQCFIGAARGMGFSEQVAARMVISVLEGSLGLLRENPDYRGLIKQVASKGGTTEAALHKFKELSLDKVWLRAVQAAYRRSRDLNKF